LSKISQDYCGTELELFENAVRWKKYWSEFVVPHLSGAVLEVGAGNGSNASLLLDKVKGVSAWCCLEPDSKLCRKISDRKNLTVNGEPIAIVNGTLERLDSKLKFDSIIYIDVLEHIEDDKAEISRLVQFLKPGGKLVVLAPAHNFLFSPFDSAIGHFRRYNKKSLIASMAAELKLIKIYYLDSVGLLASLGNRTLLKQSMPNSSQIKIWDNFMVPHSRWLDPILGYGFGKTIVGIWQKTSP